MASAHCGTDSKCFEYDMRERRMVITFMKDNYGYYSTIFISLEGSPPKAYAVLKVCCDREFKVVKEGDEMKLYGRYDKQFDDRVCINRVKVMYFDFDHYKTVREIDMDKPVFKLSLKELFIRKDVIIMNGDL
jgi:hypothetical protein